MLHAVTQESALVLLVEDDAVTRRMLSLSIEKEPSLQLLAALDSRQTALAWLEKEPIDILVVDLGLPDGSGIDVIRHCTKLRPAAHIMVITTSSDEDNVIASIEAGASGYVLKDAGQLDIVAAIRELQEGGSPISPSIARKVLAKMRTAKVPEAGADESAKPTVALTKRESMILDLIARGDTYGEVARQLSLSVGTVQTHIKNIYDKLSVHSRGEAVYEANRRGLLQLDRLKSR
ncbi:response regulator [Oxalicibacterium faecigallinarum]|uniref:DNA-binding response regulator n=1 Tax=Oxalicibacterium faecigallinarum TaxID=573741 RepID=A0A8J3ARP8_9BURK|nr:response regulator transcription factor [Oxalicibacterium faecigallinarum]GGI19698.1 DNA-binding response regulator [Oxalicibacterium faecigallinarum]